MIILAIIIALAIGFILGRGSVKFTYGGNIVMSKREAEEGTTITTFSLEIATPVDELDRKKHVIFKVVSFQDSLL